MKIRSRIVLFITIFLLLTLYQIHEPIIKEELNIIHVIGNNHIDPVWLWNFEEGLEIIRSVFSSVIEKMKIYPEFTFSASSAFFYYWMERVNPELFKEISKRIKEGRWDIVGGFWIEPDCNLISGESFVRQGLYGQRYFKGKFGKKAKVGYNPDSFGHNFALPQILNKLDLKYYVFLRPEEHEKSLQKDLFFWKGLDGSKVLTYRIPMGCNLRGEILRETIRKKMKDANLDTHMVFYEAGDYVDKITDENINIIKDISQYSNAVIKFSTPDRFFEEVKDKKEILTLKDELQYHARGCYSNLWWVKKKNRKLENLLLSTEKISVLGEYLGLTSYPQEEITSSWKDLLFTQFHDIIGGVCIKEVYQKVKNIYGNIENILNNIIILNLKKIFKNIDTSKEGLYIIIFNPTTFEREFPIEIEIPGNFFKITLLDEKGNSIPFQLEAPSSIGFINRKKIIFISKLPPFGYTSYRIIPEERKITYKNILKIGKFYIENSWLYFEIDPNSGYIKRIFDKINKKEVLKDYGAIPIIIRDESDTWGHGVDKFKDEIGRFKLEEIRILEEGPIRGVIRVKYKYENSYLIQDFILYRDLKYIEVRLVLDWHEKHKMLKLSFPLDLEKPKAIYQIPYGFIERPCNGEENPGLSFINIEDKNYGLSLINDAKYSYDVDSNILSLTIVRSPVYAHHNPQKLNQRKEYEYLDQERQEFKYILFPYKGSWKENKIIELSESFNNPPFLFIEGSHKGDLPLS